MGSGKWITTLLDHILILQFFRTKTVAATRLITDWYSCADANNNCTMLKSYLNLSLGTIKNKTKQNPDTSEFTFFFWINYDSGSFENDSGQTMV